MRNLDWRRKLREQEQESDKMQRQMRIDGIHRNTRVIGFNRA